MFDPEEVIKSGLVAVKQLLKVVLEIQSPKFGGCFKIFSLYRAKVHLAKYMSLWLIAEGIVILSGLGYNGRDAAGNILWNGGANVKLGVYENSTRFQHVRQRYVGERESQWKIT
jgi:hypothetical protein